MFGDKECKWFKNKHYNISKPFKLLLMFRKFFIHISIAICFYMVYYVMHDIFYKILNIFMYVYAFNVSSKYSNF